MSPRLAALALLLGCGPRVILDAGTDGDDADGSDADATTSEPGTNDATTTPSSTVGTGPSSDDDPNPTIVDDFGPGGECWQVQPLFEAPDYVEVIPSDQDGDGRDELWLSYNEEGPGPGETTVYAIDHTGAQLVEYIFEGFLVAIGDIEGDGMQDLVTITFGNGPPYFAYAPATGPANFVDELVMLDLELENFVTGFFDATLDDYADGFSLRDDGVLELLSGDGIGSFQITSELALPLMEGYGFAAPVESGPGLAVFGTVADFTGDSCAPSIYRLLRTEGGELAEIAASKTTFGSLQAAVTLNDFTGLYVDECDEKTAKDVHTLHLLYTQGGTNVLLDLPLIGTTRWVTSGDFDGDGVRDLVYDDYLETMTFSPGIDPFTFADPVFTDVPLADTRNNNVRAVDMDGDGRDELIRGSVIEDGDPQLAYDRIFLGPC